MHGDGARRLEREHGARAVPRSHADGLPAALVAARRRLGQLATGEAAAGDDRPLRGGANQRYRDLVGGQEQGAVAVDSSRAVRRLQHKHPRARHKRVEHLQAAAAARHRGRTGVVDGRVWGPGEGQTGAAGWR
jgi:hypothetical protein